MSIWTPTLGQSFRDMVITLDAVEEVDVVWLDGVLARVFNLELEPVVGTASAMEASDSWLLELIWRGLLLGREFLQAAGIPIFATGYIASLEHATVADSWVVHLGVPDLGGLDPECHRIAYGQGIHFIQQLVRFDYSESQMESLRNLAVRKIIMPLARRVQARKSTIPLLRAAHQLGIPFLHVGGGTYQLGWGSRSRKVDGSTTDGDATLGSRLAQSKVRTASLLRMAGLPAPVHQVVRTRDEALAATRTLDWPLVVKPADGDRGEGVTVGVGDDQQLADAFARALSASPRKQVIVEQGVPGVCHRLFVASGRLLYGVKRLPKSVVGDGRHSVTELIEIANRAERAKPPWRRETMYPSDDLAVVAARKAGFAMTTIPVQGQLVPLRAIESTADGGYDVDVSQDIHPDNIEVALRAAELFHLEVAGIDIISTDISQSWTKTCAIINEVNYSPLLGGGSISKSHLPEFLGGLLSARGRIPIHVHVGGVAALTSGMEHQARLVASGARCYLTSHCLTLDPWCIEIAVPGEGLYGRCRSLLLNRRVDQMILVLHNDELLKAGLPVDCVDSLVIYHGELVNEAGHPLSKAARQRILNLLQAARSRIPGEWPGESHLADDSRISTKTELPIHSTEP